jgi:hypothetical protein
MENECSRAGCAKAAVARGLCPTHWMAWRRAEVDFASLYGNVERRFWSKVDKRGDDECWPWTGTLEWSGYGQFFTNGTPRLVKAHRYSYELLVGPIPGGLDLDHTCHDPKECPPGDQCPHRRCVNPAHLEPVTERENTLRSGSSSAQYAVRTHCANGHEFTPETTAYRKGGARRCKLCKNARERERYRDRN